mmetsp:Transcript_19939/g.50284  ORF Transcript_19939/g.50284 Transcript_19939/m.50284 type:complete len:203 (-) Transcript_19939:928-1536(-)
MAVGHGREGIVVRRQPARNLQYPPPLGGFGALVVPGVGAVKVLGAVVLEIEQLSRSVQSVVVRHCGVLRAQTAPQPLVVRIVRVCVRKRLFPASPGKPQRGAVCEDDLFVKIPRPRRCVRLLLLLLRGAGFRFCVQFRLCIFRRQLPVCPDLQKALYASLPRAPLDWLARFAILLVGLARLVVRIPDRQNAFLLEGRNPVHR